MSQTAASQTAAGRQPASTQAASSRPATRRAASGDSAVRSHGRIDGPLDLISPFRLDGRVCVVTGASSGFGVRFAEVFAAAGAKVVVAARRADRLERLASQLPDAIAVSCDVGDDDACHDLIARVVDHYGRVDVLVNNAGTSDAVNPAEQADIESFRRVVDINLNACFLLAGLAAADMIGRESAGSIINVASVHGHVASAPNLQPAYAASKAGLVNLTAGPRRAVGDEGGAGQRPVPGVLRDGADRTDVRRRPLDGVDQPQCPHEAARRSARAGRGAAVLGRRRQQLRDRHVADGRRRLDGSMTRSMSPLDDHGLSTVDCLVFRYGSSRSVRTMPMTRDWLADGDGLAAQRPSRDSPRRNLLSGNRPNSLSRNRR